MFSVDLSTRDGDGHVIVELRGAARHAGGDLLLAAPRREVSQVLTLTRLIDVFPVHASVDEATRVARRRAGALAGRPVLAGRPALAAAT